MLKEWVVLIVVASKIKTVSIGVITGILLTIAAYLLFHPYFSNNNDISNKGTRINETQTDIQRIGQFQSAIINRLATIENRIRTVSGTVTTISKGLREVNSGIKSVSNRISRSQESLDTESDLIREGQTILEEVRKRN